ncbi:MAG: hypothetical protein AAFR16_12715 [Pseudomonadota bacterium]
MPDLMPDLRAAAAIAAVLSLGAGALPAGAENAEDPAPNGCPASSSVDWRAEDGDAVAVFAVAAHARGPSCADAAILLTMRDPAGRLATTAAFDPRLLFDFGAPETPEQMVEALTRWLLEPGDGGAADVLPEWAEGAEQPGGEFPFFPEPWIDRSLYEALRALNAPLFCVIQGGESSGCYAADVEAGRIDYIGAQSFPG